MRYVAFVTLHAKVAFDAPNDEAAQTQSDYFDGHPQAVANRARLQHGWIGDSFGTIALHEANDVDEPTRELFSI